MTDFLHLPYRPCVGIALFNKAGKVFVGKRLDNPSAWQMPQGGIDEGETLERAAYREMKEEIGTDKADIIEIAHEPIRYDLPPELLGHLWGGQYRGQEQTWVALRFTGEEKDVNLNAHEPAEFSEWKWIEFSRVPELIVPFKRKTYEEIVRRFIKHTQ